MSALCFRRAHPLSPMLKAIFDMMPDRDRLRAALAARILVCALTALLFTAGLPIGQAHAQGGPQEISEQTGETTGETAPEEAPAPAAPQGLAALVTALLDASYSEKAEIAEQIAQTGDPRSAEILEAFSQGVLMYTDDDPSRVVIALKDDGPYADAISGAELGMLENVKIKKIRINNRLRGDLAGLIARLALTSDDPDRRLEAAENAFAAADAGSLPAIETALEAETDDDVKTTLLEAKAAITVKDAGASDEALLEAIAILRDRGDLAARNALLGMRSGTSDEVQQASDSAEAHIQRVLSYWNAAQNVIYGLSLGSVLLLAAIGLAITFGVMGVINMAHGEMIMLGAYTTFVVQQVVQSVAPSLMDVSLLIAIPAAFIVAGAAGIVIERTVIRFLYGRPLETLLATWGLSLILQQTVRTIFGPTNKPVIAPSWMSGSIELGGLTITESRMWIIIFAILVLAALMALFKYTQLGTQIRAVTQNRKMAASMGVRTNMVDAFTFGLGSGVAGMAGVALSQIDNVSPNLGQSYIIDSFMVVVFGGVGNLWGTLVGALSLGVANKFLEPYAGAVVGKILVLVFIILFIQRRPRGLFALKGRSVES